MNTSTPQPGECRIRLEIGKCYLNSLDQIHEAEKLIPDFTTQQIYASLLWDEVGSKAPVGNNLFNALHATAAQRVDALLMTIGEI